MGGRGFFLFWREFEEKEVDEKKGGEGQMKRTRWRGEGGERGEDRERGDEERKYRRKEKLNERVKALLIKFHWKLAQVTDGGKNHEIGEYAKQFLPAHNMWSIDKLNGDFDIVQPSLVKSDRTIPAAVSSLNE